MELSEALSVARALVREHGLDGWTVGLDRAKARAAACHFRDRRITLSGHLTALHAEHEVRDSILHEIAHALVGPRHGHDEVWRATALAIGSSGTRCVQDGPAVTGNWWGRCGAGHRTTRHRRPERVMTCAQCSPAFDVRHLIEWTYRGGDAPMHPNYAAELRGLLGDGPAPVGRRLRVGQRVRVTAPGDFEGSIGTIVKRGRTRFHVRSKAGVLTVPFALVEPAT
ncbi:MAG: SprT-like domain-containing protein [Intrasporangium sp.]|uniref:SprT-like domain-containing protein n=1 Tax=Intrasporangium sp. TaxID=1925024 RepID=UPI002648DEF8|nr:SprT-like domain-containing protein [Intrasporangium sp.]MDN5796507.1 SprT-like domain-containing protein [Intrasporangium sp.]